jgi:PAS domain S-box-containing protein
VWLLTLFFLLGLPLLCGIEVRGQASKKRVLILTAYDPNYPAVTLLNQNITATIRDGSASHVEFFYEFQENFRIPNAKYEEEMVNFLRRKYEGENINLVLTLGAPALRFLLKHEPVLFPGIPKVYYFHDESEQEAHILWPQVTGVWADPEVNKTLDFALSLQSDTENVFVVSGSSAQDQFLKNETQRQLRPYEQRLHFTYVTDLTLDELRQRVAALPPKSVVVFVSFFVDKSGNAYSGPEALSRIVSTANAPIFGIAETYMGAGIVGGNLLDFQALGKRTGETALRLMAGETARDITPQTVPTLRMADWRELRRWKLDEQKVPAGTIVRFKELTFWERYKLYVIAIGFGLLLQSGLIAWLLFTRARRRQAETEKERLRSIADAEHRRVNEVLSNVPGVVWESRTDPATGERKTTFVSKYVENMLGYKPQEWLNQPGFSLSRVHEEDRERVSQETKKLIDSKTGGVVRFRWLAKDGHVVWAEAHLAPTVDDSGHIVSVLGVTLDITEQKQAESALRRNEIQLAGIIGSAMDAIISIDEEQVVVLFNAAAEKIFGCPAAEAIGQKIDRFIPERYRSIHREHVRRFAETKTTKRQMGTLQELFGLRASGEEFPIEASISQTEVDGRKFFTVILRDVSERKRVVDELIESEERFAKAFTANPQPMSLTTVPDGVYIDVNDSFLVMSGYNLQELIGHTSVELNVWETAADRVAFFEELNRSGSVINYEMRFRRKDGEFRTLLMSSEQLEIGGKSCLLVASNDITDFMRTQQALRESEVRFRTMADTAPVMIWISDQYKGCAYFNKQWLDFTGRELEQELGYGWASGVHADDYEYCLQTYNRSFDQRVAFEMEYRLRRKDGEYRWVMDTGTPRFSSDGLFLGYIGSSIDITERKQAEVGLRQAHEELKQLKNKLEAENIYLQQELQLDQTFGDLVGQSDAIKHVLFKASQVAPTDSTVLITGETGTGKELVARAIHRASSRKDHPLIKVNCAALSPSLIESELFGHEKGAVTGASARRLGRFELANNGTIFLDEIGELSLDLQVKLLRVIQEGEFERVGGTKTIKANVRIIAATNRSLKAEIKKGTFREDLWYRLNVFPINVPPLRERKDDIPSLAEHFIAKFARRSGKTITAVSPDVMQTLQAHSWPGNVRELANVIERAVIHTTGNVLQSVGAFEHTIEQPASPPKTLEETERELIINTLERTQWRIEGTQGAARILDVNPSTLRTRMLKLGISRSRPAVSLKYKE